MQMSQVYLLVGLVAFFLLVTLVFFTRNKRAQLSAASITAFVLVLAGMTVGENNLAGYSFPALAVVLSVVDVFAAKKL